MELYLIRHTETVCDKGICYGQADVDIREPYLTIFEEIKKQLPSDVIVYSSPLLRCKKMAEFISNEIIFDERLMEMNFGNWELKNWDEIPTEEINPWMKNFVQVQVPNGESFQELYARILDFIQDLKVTSHSKIAIVTHAGVIRSFLCYEQQLPLQNAFSNNVHYGEVIKIQM